MSAASERCPFGCNLGCSVQTWTPLLFFHGRRARDQNSWKTPCSRPAWGREWSMFGNPMFSFESEGSAPHHQAPPPPPRSRAASSAGGGSAQSATAGEPRPPRRAKHPAGGSAGCPHPAAVHSAPLRAVAALGCRGWWKGGWVA
eukprot:gene16664-biopygen3799